MDDIRLQLLEQFPQPQPSERIQLCSFVYVVDGNPAFEQFTFSGPRTGQNDDDRFKNRAIQTASQQRDLLFCTALVKRWYDQANSQFHAFRSIIESRNRDNHC